MYDKASIALIPSGTKASKLYSVLPANGDGDFTHSRGSTATRVNKDGLIETVATNVPRLDYPLTNGVVGDCPHLLLEPQSTNLITYSEDFSQWTPTNATITQNTVTSPDGSLTADKIAATSITAQHRVNFTSSNLSGATTFSFFAKSAEYNSCWARIGLISAYFDLENGVSNQNLGITSSIENYGNGWYRCIMTKASSSANEICRINITTSYLNDSDFLGDNTSGIYLWGAQHEEGSYATSYIPTNGETNGVTRSADVCNSSGTSAEFNDSEGVLFAEVEFLDNTTTGYISVSDGTPDNRCIIYSAANQIVVATKSGGSGISKSATGTPTNLNKIAVAYSSSGSKFFLNGSNETGTGSFSTTPRVFAANTLDQINLDISDGSSDLYARVKQVIYFNEALSDSELQTLTS